MNTPHKPRIPPFDQQHAAPNNGSLLAVEDFRFSQRRSTTPILFTMAHGIMSCGTLPIFLRQCLMTLNRTEQFPPTIVQSLSLQNGDNQHSRNVGNKVNTYSRRHKNRLFIIMLNGCTDMRRLTTGIRSEKCVVRRFRRCANVYLHKPR